MAVPPARGGLGVGTGVISLVLVVLIVGGVAALALHSPRLELHRLLS